MPVSPNEEEQIVLSEDEVNCAMSCIVLYLFLVQMITAGNLGNSSRLAVIPCTRFDQHLCMNRDDDHQCCAPLDTRVNNSCSLTRRFSVQVKVAEHRSEERERSSSQIHGVVKFTIRVRVDCACFYYLLL